MDLQGDFETPMGVAIKLLKSMKVGWRCEIWRSANPTGCENHPRTAPSSGIPTKRLEKCHHFCRGGGGGIDLLGWGPYFWLIKRFAYLKSSVFIPLDGVRPRSWSVPGWWLHLRAQTYFSRTEKSRYHHSLSRRSCVFFIKIMYH